jgi:(1->4)-alpha-D-glucan 1-alpha-D-glucosylmutase
MALRIPASTYRLQFNHQFTFKDALEIVPYLDALGISDLYASPLTKARPGSVHGYDAVDCTQLNPEIGSEEDFEAFSSELQKRKMGLLVDIVPNHMCISGPENTWWQDVLENGPSSLYADYFNIIWDPPQEKLKGKVLLPILDQPFGKVIENQELQLIFESGSFFIEYQHKVRFPLAPLTWAAILKPAEELLLPLMDDSDPSLLELQSIITAIEHLPGMKEKDPEKCKERNREKEIIKKRLSTLADSEHRLTRAIEDSIAELNGKERDPHSFDRLEELLNDQAYRLSFWRVTNDEINYHRFFDVNELISMQVENEAVFNDMHELILPYIQKKWITGLRIDHIDGLFDPEAYFIRLQKACSESLKEQGGTSSRSFFLIAEKILGHMEKLRPQWLIFGTTGYDFLNTLNALFVVKENRVTIKQIYERFAGCYLDMEDEIFVSKRLILTASMSSELHILSRCLSEVSEQHRWSRDYTQEALRASLRDIIACFPCYRSYIRLSDRNVQPDDRDMISWAVCQAKRRNPVQDPSIFDFIQSVLLLEDPQGLAEDQIAARRDFVMRFQQLTGPVAAKGIEDTALYRYFPLASLNEVGMDPDCFGIDVDQFHEINKERFQLWPHSLSATSTHDTKRNEEVRCRINTLSENPESWKDALDRWNRLNLNHKEIIERREVPDRNEEYLLYQTLVGTWPSVPMNSSDHTHYMERIISYMIKAIKEAKLHTSWIHPNSRYEEAVRQFIEKILENEPENPFLSDLKNFVEPIATAGLYQSLTQTLLKITCPGIPDFYQGTELVEFRLVDPDNRHPIDYSNRLDLLNSVLTPNPSLEKHLDFLRKNLHDGKMKLYVTSKALNYRRNHPQLFQEGNYVPLDVEGGRSDQIISFARIFDQQCVIMAAGRFYTRFSNEPVSDEWQDAKLILPPSLTGPFRDLISGHRFSPSQLRELPIKNIFNQMPVAMLVSDTQVNLRT